jgi:hypothetical protein
MNALKLELFWGNAPLKVGVFSAPPPSVEAWGLRAVTRVDGGFQLEPNDAQPVCVRHGDRARVRVGVLDLVATSLEREPFIGRRQLRRWPWLFLVALTLSVSAFAAFLREVPEPYDDSPDRPDYPRLAHYLYPLPMRVAFRWRWTRPRPMPICIDPYVPPRRHRRHSPPVNPALWRLLSARPQPVPGIDRTVLAKVIDAHRDDILACRDGRGLHGRVLFQWTVDAGGHARDVKALSAHDDRDFETCVAVALRVWRFPPGRGNPVVYFPF